MIPRIFDTTGLIPGATPVAIHSRSAWCNGIAWYPDDVRRYAAETVPGVKHLVMDLEVPAIMELNAAKEGVTLDQVKRGVATAAAIIEIIKDERPELDVAWYDADIEDWQTILDHMEYRIRRSRPRGDNADDWYTKTNARAAKDNIDKLEWANDQLSDLRKVEGFALRRVYPPFDAQEPWKREGVIRYQWRRAVRDANGEKPAFLLYWPICQSRDKKGVLHRTEITPAGISADFAVMSEEGARNILTWRDGDEKPATITRIATIARALAAQSQGSVS